MPKINVLLIRWDRGWVDTSDHEIVGRRKEAFINLGAVDDMNDVNTAAERILLHLSETAERIVAGIHPTTAAESPYVGWRPTPNTWITVPGWDATPDDQKVVGLTVSQDNETGRLTYSPELSDVLADTDARIARWLKRMSAGAIAGRSDMATPERTKWDPKLLERKPTATFNQTNVDDDGNPGEVFTGQTPNLPAEARGELREWYTYLSTAGSTSTTSQLLLNGVVVATSIIPAGETANSAPIDPGTRITPNSAILAARVTVAGTGARGWGGQARVDAIPWSTRS